MKKIDTHCRNLVVVWLFLCCISLSAQENKLNQITTEDDCKTAAETVSMVTETQPAVSILFKNAKKQPAEAEINLKTKREDNQTYGEGPGAVVKSLILPGWGLACTSTNPGSKLYFALTPISYGLIIYGFSSNGKSKKIYKQYQDSKDQAEMVNFYKSANDKRQTYLTTVAAGVFIYVAQAGYTLIWGMHNDKYRQRAAHWKENIAFNVSPYYDLSSRSLSMNTSLSIKLNKTKKHNVY